MILNATLFLKLFETRSLKARITDSTGYVDLEITLVNEDIFNNRKDFYNYCIDLLNNSDIVLYMIRKKIELIIEKLQIGNEDTILKNNLTNLIDKINKNGLIVNIDD